jgi:hypothetical protein
MVYRADFTENYTHCNSLYVYIYIINKKILFLKGKLYNHYDLEDVL